MMAIKYYNIAKKNIYIWTRIGFKINMYIIKYVNIYIIYKHILC